MIIPQATQTTSAELEQINRTRDLRWKAERLSDWELEMFADRLVNRPKRDSHEEMMKQVFSARGGMVYSSVLAGLVYDDTPVGLQSVAWAELFHKERELMNADYEAYKASQQTPITPIEPPVIMLGVYEVADLRKAIRKVRKGRNKIVIEVYERGICIYDETGTPGGAEKGDEEYVSSKVHTAHGWDITIGVSILSYTNTYPGLLDIEPEGQVTIELIGDVMRLTGSNWTSNIKHWQLWQPERVTAPAQVAA